MPQVDAGALDDLPHDRCLAIAGGRAIVARSGDEVYAYENVCLHQNSPLAGGLVKDGVLTCPLHFWRYEVISGTVHGESDARLPSYPVTVTDGRVLVDLPPAPEARSMRDILLDHARAHRSDDA